MFSKSKTSGILVKTLILFVGIHILFSMPIIPREWVKSSTQNKSPLETSDVPSFSKLSEQIAPETSDEEEKCMMKLLAQLDDLKAFKSLKQGGPEDEVIMKMQREGKSGCEIMKYVASVSKETQNGNYNSRTRFLVRKMKGRSSHKV